MSSFIARNWRDLIKPKSVPVDSETLTEFYGKFVCEPLERGFGITLGNGLRRVLLSSLQGAAITAVKIDGALHEFTSVPDVVEDVTEIVLNMKEVVLKAHSPRTHTRFPSTPPALRSISNLTTSSRMRSMRTVVVLSLPSSSSPTTWKRFWPCASVKRQRAGSAILYFSPP